MAKATSSIPPRPPTISTIDPGVNDDFSTGKIKGDTWVNSVLKTAYTCVDDTTGAAVWTESGVGSAQDQVESKSISTPPGAPTAGDRYIVGPAATGAWTGQEDDVTQWSGAAWTFETPSVGWFLFIIDEGEWFTWSGSAWVEDSFHDHASTHENGGADEINVGGLSGELADPQPPKTHEATHHESGADELDVEDLATDSLTPSDVVHGHTTFHQLSMGQPDGWKSSVISTLNAPPGGSVGDRYRIGSSPSGVWTGHADKLAEKGTTGSWIILANTVGDVHYHVADGRHYEWSGSAWSTLPYDHGSAHTDGSDDVADFVGDSGAGGTHGLAPAPDTGDGADNKVLRADGSWDDPAYVNIIVRKGSGGTIVKGAPVYISGYNVGLDVPEVEEAQADAAATMPAIGLAAESITNSANSVVRVWGKLNGVDTSSPLVAGDEVYVSEAAPGTLVKDRPQGATSLIQKVGEILRSHASLGCIEVYGAGRTNALSNIAEGNIFKGDASGFPQSVSFLHASSHENGGGDEIDVTDLSGLLADAQTPTAHASTHKRGFGDSLEQFDAMREPTGFVDAVGEVTLSWSDVTKTLTLTPIGDEFAVWVKNTVYSFPVPQTKDISGVIAEGLWFFYYDDNGTLQASQTPWVFADHAPVALIHWDATNLTAILIGWELHGLTMDWATHEYLHDTFRMVFESGLVTSGDIAGTGAADDDAQVAVADGCLHDEDLEIDPHDGAGSGLFEQELDPIANIPVFYRDGVGGNWRKVAANTFPVKQGAARIQYNLDTAGTWSTPDATANGRFIAMWLFATNNMNEPIIAILGQREDITLSNAQDNNQFGDLSLGTLPLEEIKVLARLILQTSTTYVNTPHARTREILDLRTSFQQSAGSFVATDHQSLSGRSSTNAHPATAVQVDASGFAGNLSAADVDTQLALDTLDGLAVGGGIVTLITPSDDLAAILNAASDNSSFWLGDGSHVPSGPIDISGKSNISVFAGRGAVITAALSAALDPLITMHTNSGVVWKGVRFAITSDAAGRVVFGFDDGADSSDIKIEDCAAVNTSAGFRTRFVSNALAAESITHLSVKDCSLAGHWQNLVYMEVAATKTCDQIVIKGNNAVSDATAAPEAAVILDDTTTGFITNSQVEGNYFKNFYYGVYMLGTIYTNIVDNLITGGSQGVFGNGQDSHTAIDGNVIVDFSSAGVSSIGQYSSICGNVIVDTADGINTVGAGSVIDGNAIYSAASEGIVVFADHITISDNSIYDPSGYGIYVDGGERCTVTGNAIFGSNNAGILIEDGNNVINGNTIRSCLKGVVLTSAEECVVNGNNLESNTNEGIHITNAGSVDCVISGNQIAGGTVAISTIAARTAITGNSCTSQSGNAIELNTVVGCNVGDNTIYSPNDNGIKLTDVDNSLFTGNRITAATQYGIEIDVDSDGNKFEVNLLADNTAGAILNLGTDNEIDGKVENSVSTTDATDTVIATIAIPDDTMCRIEIDVVGFRDNGTDQATYKYVALVYRRSAGIAVLEGAVTDIHAAIESDGDWDATLDIDGGNNARIRVTGAVGSDVNWKSRHTVEAVS